MQWFPGHVLFLGQLCALMMYDMMFLEQHCFFELVHYRSHVDLCLVFSYRCFDSVSSADWLIALEQEVWEAHYLAFSASGQFGAFTRFGEGVLKSPFQYH